MIDHTLGAGEALGKAAGSLPLKTRAMQLQITQTERIRLTHKGLSVFISSVVKPGRVFPHFCRLR